MPVSATPTRARRVTAKSVNYAKEQEFTDAEVDLFEDEPEEVSFLERNNKRGRPSGSSRPLTKRASAAAPIVEVVHTSTHTNISNTVAANHPPTAEDNDEEMVDHHGLLASYANQRPVYTEKGCDPALPPIRERFPFLPEYEEDGSPKIELIVGRRPVDETEEKAVADDDDSDHESTTRLPEEDEEEKELSDLEEGGKDGARRKRNSTMATPDNKKRCGGGTRKNDDSKDSFPKKKKKCGAGTPDDVHATNSVVEYEYLVKYKGRSYLHLEWKTGADLESMNKSAKGIYRRYLKKLASQGADLDELESPEFDPSYVVPEKIVDEADQEIAVELSDKELLKWEEQRAKEMEYEEETETKPSAPDPSTPEEQPELSNRGNNTNKDGPKLNEESKDAAEGESETQDDWPDGLDYKNVTLDHLRGILKKEDFYYPVVEGSDNPYRDGYATEPPKKPRASYLFFQSTVRSYFVKRKPSAPQSELMAMLGEAWRSMDDKDKEPYQILADEEVKQYAKERVLLEKAQKPNGVWQPLRRCRQVLDRLVNDSFAAIFLEPVNLEDFPDYEEVIDAVMDLGTVRQRLESRKYQAPEQFARDMRRIWNNCKIYNQHGSAIWHVADYMSKQFERLYHAWVLEFRERYLRWADPRSRPWEHSCRVHDGKCGTPDEKMVLCDHCDGMYGFQCVTPSMRRVPSRAWHCPDCKPKLKSAKGGRMLSAVAENAARKRAELGDLPKKKITQTMFLVKWAGLGYELCTWETKEDVSNDALIASFHKLNNGFSDEADLPQEVIDDLLIRAKHVNCKNAGGAGVIPLLRSQLYAQNRGMQFIKFGMDVPDVLCLEMGPKTNSVHHCPRVVLPNADSETIKEGYHHPREVVECLTDLVFRVSRQQRPRSIRSNTLLPPPLTGEYDSIIPITSKGLMMNVGEMHGSVAFLGYRPFPGGSKGPAEIGNLIRSVGDKIIAVDGASTLGKSFQEVINMLRESGKNKYAYMRFLESRFAICEDALASAGAKGRYAHEELLKKFMTDRQRMVVQRKARLAEEGPDLLEKGKNASAEKKNSEDESEAGSEGSFQPESDDEELVGTIDLKEVSPVAKKDAVLETGKSSGMSEEISQSAISVKIPENSMAGKILENGMAGEVFEAAPATEVAKEFVTVVPVEAKQTKGDNAGSEVSVLAIEAFSADNEKLTGNVGFASTTAAPVTGILCREETTRSLGLRLLDVDLGYSSDEAGDEDCAYFLDGVDETFANADELEKFSSKRKLMKGIVKLKDGESKDDVFPASKSEFSALGDRGKLAVAVALSTKAPAPAHFENFPEVEEKVDGTAFTSSKFLKRSTVKVEQVNAASGEKLHVWANVESAAATLQLPLPALRQVLRGEYDEDIGEEVGGFRWRYAAAGAKVTAGNVSQSRGGGGKKAKEAWLEFRDKLYDPSEPHIYKNGNRLRDYQVDGVNWLASMWYKRQGCILADEMGLGKTVQIVCYIEHIFRVEKIHRPFLVVVPLSTVEHWRREFEGWTNMVCCVYHDRQRVWRDVMREYEWYYEDRPHTSEFLKFDVLVTTYDTLIGDFDVISQIPFRVAVVDEAHRLRNQKGKLLECMREISARGTMQYGFQSRVLMSGTPLQNDLTELWTLLNFIEPFKFPDLDCFQVNFGNMANRSQVEALQSMISPFMLRRVKEDVAKDIPAKEETVIDVEMTSFQKQYYRAIFEHNHAFLNIGATRQTAPKLMNIQMELRKVCNHPYLLDGVEHRETDRQFREFLDSGRFDGTAPDEQQHMLNEHGYIMTSGKMVLLDKLLPKLRQEGHKVLIFSQMVKMLDLISEYCEFRDFRYERLDGRIRGTERQKSIDRFEREEDSFLFLLSTRAGGVGINLVSATVVILFDSDWNPQNDVQAQARCHRIGQTKDVRVYRLVTSRSFEQEMFDRASKKLGLEQAVLGTFEKEWDDDKPTQQEMEQLLKRGAYALLDDDNDEVTKQFCADDIESILAKRTRTRVVEGTKTASWLNKQGMMVSKSKFTSETGETLDMDDPLFWQKVMPDFVTPSIMLQKFRDLEDEIEGKVRGPGRGRGRWKKKNGVAAENGLGAQDENQAESHGIRKDDDKSKLDSIQDDSDKEGTEVRSVVDALLSAETLDEVSEDEDTKHKSFKKLSRNYIRKINKFMSDLKSMMQNTFEEDDEDALSSEEKDACQKLLLTVSVKDKLFSEEQRLVAKKFLKRFEGNRRRRCRISEQPRFRPSAKIDEPVVGIREELMITGKKRKKRRKRGEAVEVVEPAKKKRRTCDNSGGYVGDDGYLHHSDSEDDWSDVGRDIYLAGTRKDIVSRKEANRRRHWAADDDAATAAGRAWPVFPRPMVNKVLTTVLDNVIKYDEASGGVFSVPVPKDEFPEYYELIKKPIDYGTMKRKLDNGEYRSAQAMQKDFILIMQNCRTFNADSSDIVREAREQHLLRPKFLKEAAAKHDLFLAEDGSVLEIIDDKPGSAKKKGKKKTDDAEDNAVESDAAVSRKKQQKARQVTKATADSDNEAKTDVLSKNKSKKTKSKATAEVGNKNDRLAVDAKSSRKTRIRINVTAGAPSDNDADEAVAVDAPKDRKKPAKRKRDTDQNNGDESAEADISASSIPKKRKKISGQASKQKKGSKITATPTESSDDNRPLHKIGSKQNQVAAPDEGSDDPKPIYLDIQYWKKCRESLDGTYKAARKNLRQHNGWELPPGVPHDMFADVAIYTLDKMKKHDRYSIFAEEVTDKEAPGYSEVVTIPMDFGKMREKVNSGAYGTGSKAADAFNKDFQQVFDNCYLYNDEGNEVTDEAVRVLGYLPETFVAACIHVAQQHK